MAGDIKLKIDGDASGLLSAVKSAMAQIQKEADRLNISPNAAGKNSQVSPGSQAFQQNLQATRMQEQKARAEQQALQIANRALADKERELAKIARQEAASVNNAKQLDYLAKERNRAEREYQTLIGTRKRLEASLSSNSGGPGGSGPNIPKGGITSLSGLAGAVGVPVIAIGAIATALAGLKAIESIRQYVVQAPLRARELGATAFNAQGQSGQLLSSAFNGGLSQDLAFSKQRAQAATIADEQIKKNYETYITPFLGVNVAEKVLGKDVVGSAEHFNIGQTVTALGARVGLPGFQSAFENQKKVEQEQIQSSQEEAIKTGPGYQSVRTDVQNKYLQDYRRNLDFQRQTGQNENQFREYLGGVNAAGFSDELGMGMSSAILGSGGSTRSAIGNSAFALQMGRQYDLTNAGQALGSISGQLGSSQMSKDALIAIQAEGTRIGLNRSDMREENRRFVEMAASAIGQSSVTSGAGVDQILGTLTKFMGGADTVSGLEAGKKAYEAYQSQSNVQSGPSAVMRGAYMRKDSVLGKLNERDRAKLSLMPESEINPDNMTIQEMADRNGVSASDIVTNMHGSINKSLFVNPTTDKAISQLRKAYKNALDYTPEEIQKLEGRVAGELELEQAGQGLSYKERVRLGSGIARDENTDLSKLQDQIKQETSGAGKNVRSGDEMERQAALASSMANRLFTSIQKDIEATASETANFTQKVNALVTAMKGGDQSSILKALNAIRPDQGALSPSNQTQTGSGGPPGGR